MLKHLADLFLSGADDAFAEDGLPDLPVSKDPEPDEGDVGHAEVED